MNTFIRDQLAVRIFASRDQMGKDAADMTAAAIRLALESRDTISMIFAAAPSQNELLGHLVRMDDIPWGRIDAFHMDEYIGLAHDHPQSFAHYLDDHLFGIVRFRSVNRINGAADDPVAECARYSDLLDAAKPDIVCMGIGENGHIAFNDPPVADFSDPSSVKVVELDRPCREQQVHDGCFAAVTDVPTHAITLTIPALTSPASRFCVVPGASKRSAVKGTIDGPVSTSCPASVLRTVPGTTLFLDAESGADYLKRV